MEIIYGEISRLSLPLWPDLNRPFLARNHWLVWVGHLETKAGIEVVPVLVVWPSASCLPTQASDFLSVGWSQLYLPCGFDEKIEYYTFSNALCKVLWIVGDPINSPSGLCLCLKQMERQIRSQENGEREKNVNLMNNKGWIGGYDQSVLGKLVGHRPES